MERNPVSPEVVVFAPPLDPLSGGSVVLHALARELLNSGLNVGMGCFQKPFRVDPVYGQAVTSRDIGPKTIAIYPEVVRGNPLGAKTVVRWILCQVGRHCSVDTPETWGPRDLVYHYSSFDPYMPNARIIPLTVQTIDPRFSAGGLSAKSRKREGTCVIIRKAHKFHGPKLPFAHPEDAELLPDDASLDQLLEAFTRHELLYSYDPYTFHIFHAALAGCIPIVAPLPGIDKRQWLNSTYLAEYLAANHLNDVAGVAWGTDDLPHARATLDKTMAEQAEVLKFNNRTIIPFVEDLRQLLSSGAPARKIPTVTEAFPRRTFFRTLYSKLRYIPRRLGFRF